MWLFVVAANNGTPITDATISALTDFSYYNTGNGNYYVPFDGGGFFINAPNYEEWIGDIPSPTYSCRISMSWAGPAWGTQTY